MRFHIFAASATVVQTVLHPARSMSFCGLLYNRLYITLAPRPGSHCKRRKETETTLRSIFISLLQKFKKKNLDKGKMEDYVQRNANNIVPF